MEQVVGPAFIENKTKNLGWKNGFWKFFVKKQQLLPVRKFEHKSASTKIYWIFFMKLRPIFTQNVFNGIIKVSHAFYVRTTVQQQCKNNNQAEDETEFAIRSLEL